jgi:NAD(P)-dependent dehydrogenase (short-subunit alcohol dehydrogenase family)
MLPAVGPDNSTLRTCYRDGRAKPTKSRLMRQMDVRSWETNVFGVLAVYQAMLPLLRQSSDARIVNVSSGVGSLTTNADPAFPYRTRVSSNE